MTLSANLRRAIWERDQGICGICGETVNWADLDIDHLAPRMIGGSDAPENLRASHHLCNMKRGVKDRRQHGIGPGRPGANSEQRVVMTVDNRTRRRLVALAAKLELPQAAIVRTAVREMAERHGVEGQPPPASPEEA